MNSKRQAHMESLSSTIKLPSDILAGAPILTMTGQTELCIENYKGIIEYTGDLLRIQTKIGRIHIVGKNLIIRYYTVDEMKVSGWIEHIDYCR